MENQKEIPELIRQFQDAKERLTILGARLNAGEAQLVNILSSKDEPDENLASKIEVMNDLYGKVMSRAEQNVAVAAAMLRRGVEEIINPGSQGSVMGSPLDEFRDYDGPEKSGPVRPRITRRW